MDYQPIVVTPQNRRESLNIVGEEIAVLVSGTDTGSYEIFLQTGPEGAGPPPHNHPWDEAFFVLQGRVGFSIGGQDQLASPGTLVQVPAGVTHWFRIAADDTQMLSITSRPGAAALFTELDREVAPVDPDLGKFIEIANAHGLTVIAPPT